MFLKACLNGNRTRDEHPLVPYTPDELAAAAKGAVAAGADALHVHPRDVSGRETFDPESVEATLQAIRTACPSVLVGVSTGAWIEPEIARRVALMQSWEVLPDFASVNLSEDGAERVMEVLLVRGVGVEAGLWTPEDVRRLASSGHAPECLRVLLEPREEDPGAAERTAREIEEELARCGLTAPRLLHGQGAAAWPVFDLAFARVREQDWARGHPLPPVGGARARQRRARAGGEGSRLVARGLWRVACSFSTCYLLQA